MSEAQVSSCDVLQKQPQDVQCIEAKSIPIIAVTGWEMGACVEKARRAGCDLVLVKPCLPETLLAEIERLLNLPATKLKPTRRS